MNGELYESEDDLYYTDGNSDPEGVTDELYELSKIYEPRLKHQEYRGGFIVNVEKGNYFIDTLVSNGIKYVKYNKEMINKYKEEWYKRVIGDTCVEDIYIEDFLWHAFSFKRVSCDVGKNATLKFNMANKEKIFIFFQHRDYGYYLENANALSAEVVGAYNDIYVTACDFSWTYIHTHESYCGPYFRKI